MANSDLKLYYYDVTGLAELSRMVLAAADKKYEDVRFKPEEWSKYKDDAPFGQCPFLEVDGQKFAASYAIARFLAREFGFYGKSSLESLAIDQFVNLIEDMLKPKPGDLPAFMERDEAKKAEIIRVFKEETSTKFMGHFEKALGNSKSGWLVGDQMSLADIAVFDINNGMLPKAAGQMCSLDTFPKVKALCEKVGENPGIKAWMKNRPQEK